MSGHKAFFLEQAVKIPVEDFSWYGTIKPKWSAMSWAQDESTLLNIKKEQEDDESLY